MSSIRQMFGLSEIVMLLAIAGLLTCLRGVSGPTPVHFETLEHFEDFAKQHRLYYHSGSWMTHHSLGNFFIGDHPLLLDRLPTTRLDCGMTEAWRGIVWAAACSNELSFVSMDTIGGHRRCWGNIIVAGDPSLMDRIERLFRRPG